MIDLCMRFPKHPYGQSLGGGFLSHLSDPVGLRESENLIYIPFGLDSEQHKAVITLKMLFF